MIAGTLELQMTTDLVKLITGTQQASRQVVGSMKQIEDAARLAKSALELLGVSLSVNALVGFAKSTIDAVARMKDLGEQAGISAAAMSKFEAPTRAAGSSLDLTAAAMAKMSRAAVAGLNPLSAQGQAFAAIGISTQQLRTLAPDQLFELIARQLDKYSDGIAKNAVMQAIFSRGGAEMNGVMKAIAQTTELHATLTQKDIDAAKEFQEKLVELKMAGDAFWRSVASDWIPGLTKIVNAVKDIVQGIGFWKTAMLGIASIFGVDLAEQLGTTSDKVLTLKNKIIDLQNAIKQQEAGGLANSAAIIKRYTDQIANLQKQIDALQGRAKGASISYGNGGEEGFMAGGMPSKPAPGFDPDAVANALAAKKAFDQENASLDMQIAKLRGVGEMEAYITKLEGERYKFLTPAQKKELEDKEKIILALEDQKKATDAAIASAKAYVDALDKAGEVIARANEAATQQTDDLQFQLSILGKSADEQEKLTALRQADLDLLKQIDALPPELSQEDRDAQIATLTQINELRKQGIAATLDQIAASKNELSVWGDLADRAGQFFSDLVQHGRGAFDDLKQMVRSFLAEMVALFAKRWILQMGASALGGTAGGSALASQAATVGQGTLAGSAMSGLGGLISGAGTGLAGAFGTSVLTGAGDFVGTGFAGLVGNAALAVGATDATAAAIASWVPVIGWVVAIGLLLYSIFGHKGGGPKTQGAFLGLFSGSGNLLSNLPNAEDVDVMHGTQPESNAQAQVLGTQMARGLVQGITALGGSPSAFRLGAAFAMDPAGTAPSFAHFVLQNAQGQEVFRYHNDNLSRDPQEFQQQVQAIMQRVLVGALQNDNTLPDAIRRWVHTIDATTASDADITRILQGAAALKSLYGEMDSLNAAIAELNDPTGVTAITDSLKAMDKSVSDAKKALDTAAASGDPQQYLQAEQAYRQAVMNRYQQEISMVQQLVELIRQTKEQAYQFAIDIAGRINAVGGNVDIASIALGRATSLQAGIGPPNPASASPGTPIATQIQDLQSYVQAIDTWYQSRRQAILADAQQQADAINAANKAQADAWNARASQLQEELAAVTQMKDIVAQAAQMSKQMELSSANPLAAAGRLDIARQDVADLQAKYLAATTDEQRAAIAQQLLAAVQTAQGLAQSTLQRPSKEYQDVYNQMQQVLALLGQNAESIDQKQLDLTQQIKDAQDKANYYASLSVTAEELAKDKLDALDKGARGYYEWAQSVGAGLYQQQIEIATQQLNAITGGMEPQLFIAKKTGEMRDLLQDISDNIADFLKGIGGEPANGGGDNGGGSPDSSGGASGGASGGGNPASRQGAASIVIVNTRLSKAEVLDAARTGGSALRRIIEQS